jgi:hypothetical protein
VDRGDALECATFHILTPYPGTPLFRQIEAGTAAAPRLGLYDTAHVVFRPRRMSPEQLAEGYAWCYGGCSPTARSGRAGRAT